jgi:D-glycero-D-manno-heptose 1,7-bisphosphate phosphatase
MRVIFLDRDGVINENRSDHVKSWDEFRFLPGALDALEMLHSAGYYVFVVTNQAIIARGLATRQTLDEIHERMLAQVVAYGGKIHDLRYCPHDTGDACNCRKPKPGMLYDLAARWRFDLSRAYMIGDALTDIAAARTAGCQPVLVRTGRGTEQLHQPELLHCPPAHIAANLLDAVLWMFAREGVTPVIDDSRAVGQLYTASVAPASD